MTETNEDPPTEEAPELPELARGVGELVRAAFGGIVLQTDEPDDALATLYQLCDHESWQLASWTLSGGLIDGQHAGDPLGALDALDAADGQTPMLLVLRGVHRLLGSPELISRLERRLFEGKTGRYAVVLIVPGGGVDLPVELQPLLTTVRHERPGRVELEEIARTVASEPGECPSDASFIIDAAKGLTRQEAESACALSLVRHGRLESGPLWQLKSEAIRSGGLMSIARPEDFGCVGFAGLRGLDSLKDFAFRSLTASAGDARGVLLVSPPGAGKTSFAQALAVEANRPLVRLDIGRLLASLVGESERNLRSALVQIEAISKCVVLVDEADKCLSAGDRDSGVGQRLLGQLLTWLQDRAATSGAYVILTANDARKLPPELIRAERLDATFFVDLPDEATRADIWTMYFAAFGHAAEVERPADIGWSGAEIRSACRLARLLDITPKEASRYVVPVSATSGETVRKLRRWASGRCVDAHAGGTYRATDEITQSKRRSVTKRAEPSDN